MSHRRVHLPSPAMVVALLALCVALSSSAAAGPVADGAASLTAKVKQALGIAKKADRRSKQALRLAREPGPKGDTGAQGPKGDTGAPGPVGSIQGAPAGGDLTGSYPDPQIAADAVDSPELAPFSVGFDELAPGSVSATKIGVSAVQENHINNGAVTSLKLRDGEVRGLDLGPFVLRESAGVLVPGGTAGNGDYETRSQEVICSGFAERPIAGGGYGDAASDTAELTITQLKLGSGSVTVRGGNDSGSDRIFKAQAYCLGL